MGSEKETATPIVKEQDITDEAVYEDSTVFNPQVFEKIAGRVARETPGILEVRGNAISRFAENLKAESSNIGKGIFVESEGQNVVVSMKIVMAYKADAQKIFSKLRKRIAIDIKKMTGFELVELNVQVVDIMTPENYRLAKEREREMLKKAGISQNKPKEI